MSRKTTFGGDFSGVCGAACEVSRTRVPCETPAHLLSAAGGGTGDVDLRIDLMSLDTRRR